MSRIFLSPSKYVQGVGALGTIGKHAVNLGRRAMVLGGRTALSESGGIISSSLEAEGVSWVQEKFTGECCDTEINRLVETTRSRQADVIIVAGGGKVIDTGKAVSHELKLPIIVVPTIAATDAPCSGEAVIYSEDGIYDREIVLRSNPDCVLVDTGIIANAPAEFFVSGMGDALATYWEADTCLRSNKPNTLTGEFPPTLTAMAIARLCYDTLLENGLGAKLAVEQNAVTPAVEAIVEANILLSGLGFESGGLAAAHSIHNGLTVLDESDRTYHGQKVAFGTISQLVLEGRSSEDLDTVLEFCLSVGLPVCMADLHVHKPTRDDIRRVAEASVADEETIHATWFPVTATMVEDAIWTADALGKAYTKG